MPCNRKGCPRRICLAKAKYSCVKVAWVQVELNTRNMFERRRPRVLPCRAMQQCRMHFAKKQVKSYKLFYWIFP